MKLRIDGVGEPDSGAYIEVAFASTDQGHTYVELGAGYRESVRRASVTGLNRCQALILANALKTMAESLD